MKKNKTLIGALVLGLLSSIALTGCDALGTLKNAGKWVVDKTNDILPWSKKDEGNEDKPDSPSREEDNKDQEAADGVIAKINALTNSSKESDVVAVRTAYEALTAAQKALVTNLVLLEKQEKRIADDKLVKEVVDMINALANDSTESEVNAAFTKYSNLDDALKEKVTNLGLLLAQKARIDAKVVVDPVITMINSLNDSSTKEEVRAAEAAYNALSENDKKYVDNNVVAKLNAQLQRVLNADIDAAKQFIDSVVVEDLISDASVITVLKDMNELDLSDSIINNLSNEQKDKYALLKKTIDSYEYAGVNQAKTWKEDKWENDSYGSLEFGETTLNNELNAEVRPFEVTYFFDGETTHKEFGITLVGDSNLKDSKKEAVFYFYNPDIDTNMRIDFAKGTDESFCDGGTIALKHGWNRITISLGDVSDKNVINLMVGIFNNEGGITETSGWMISSFVKYDDTVPGAIRTEYYRIAKIMNAYLNNYEATDRNEYATICEEYAKLTVEEKAMLPEGVAAKIAADESAFKTVDALALNELLGEIPAITDQTNLTQYAVDYLLKLNEYKAQYDAFDADQKALVSNVDILYGLEDLNSFGILSDGSKQITGWADYIAGPNSVTVTDPIHGTVQKVTLENSNQTAMLFPVLEGYEQFDVVYFTVYCPEGFMEVLGGDHNWPYDFGTLEVGWNTVCVPVEVFEDTYPTKNIALFLNGAGDWLFGSMIGFVNEKGAADLVSIINNLTYTGEESEEAAIVAARASYNTLGFASKGLVSNLSKLVELEATVDQHYADAVINQIAALEFDSNGSTQEAQKAIIEAAREAFNALNDARKAMVTNLSKLEELEAAVAQYYKDELVNALKADIEGLVEITSATSFDVALASYVKTGSIKANQFYADEIDSTHKDKVEGVISGFELCYTEITNSITAMSGEPEVSKKTDAVYGEVTSIAGTNSNVQVTFAPAANDTVANYDFIYVLMKTAVDGSFNLWGSTWGMDDVQTFGELVGGTWNILKINTALFNTSLGASEKLYNLDFVLGDLTNNHEIMMTAAYGFVDKTAAGVVSEQIGNLKFDEHSLDEENAIIAARTAYNALGKGSKACISNYDALVAMETAVDLFYVNPVISKIDALEFDPNGSTQEAQKAAIEAARGAYNALSDARKALVTNLSKLEEMEVAVAAYYKTERLTALEGEISALPEEITTATEVIDVMKIKVALAKYEAHDLYAELQQPSKDKIAALKEDIADIYTTLLDGNSALVGWDYGPVGNTASGTDAEFGAIQKITFEDDVQHSLRLPTSEEYEKYDEIYISVYCPSGSLTLVNGSVWPYAYGSVSIGWNVIKVPGSVFEGTYPDNSLGFLFNGAGEWKFGMVLGCAAQEPEVPARTITFGEGGITLQSENKASTDWPSCSKTEINDEKVGLAYQYNASEFAGDVKGNQLYWVMNEQQVANVVAGFGSEMDIFVPDDGNSYSFAFQCGDTTTPWYETSRKTLVNGQWNHIVINQEWLAGLDFTGSGNVAFVRLYGGDFQTNEIKLTPIYKREAVSTSLSLGTLTDTGADHDLLGNIYDYARKIDFKGSTKDLNTISYFDPIDFATALGEDKEELVFEIYNPNDTDYSIHFAGGAGWTDGSTTTLKAKSWTRVTITKQDVAIGKTGRLYVYVNGMADQTGWQVTDIFAI